MEIARALVLATTGDKLPWSSVGSRPKPLAPVATKPILFHTLEALRSAGVLETALLVEESVMPVFREAVGDGSRWDMSITYTACGRKPMSATRSISRTTSSATSPCSSSRRTRSFASICATTSSASRARTSTRWR